MTSGTIKLIIAIDIDDVLFPFVSSVVDHHNSIKGTSLVAEDFLSFNFREYWGGSEEESMQMIDSFLSKNVLHLQPMSGARHALNRLKQDFTIILVTARNGEYQLETNRWLQKHFIGLFDSIVFAGNPQDGRVFRTKGEICQEIGAVLLIDDHPKNILSVIERGIDGVLFGEKPWSVMNELPAAFVTHCKDWAEVERYIYGDWQPKQLSR